MKANQKITEVLEPGLTDSNKAIIARLAKAKAGKTAFPERTRAAKERAKSIDWSVFSPNTDSKIPAM